MCRLRPYYRVSRKGLWEQITRTKIFYPSFVPLIVSLECYRTDAEVLLAVEG
jgi:hypothetical protein